MAEFHFVSRRTHKLYKQYRQYFPSRRAAFRAAKRDAGIPMSRHPDAVVYPRTPAGEKSKLDERNVRFYVFDIWIGAIALQFRIREDLPDKKNRQSKHFNAGYLPDKLKKHYYWDHNEDK